MLRAETKYMRCANPACSAETLYLRSGKIYAVDFLGGAGNAGECQIVQRRVIWLCDACAGEFTVETWRPPGEQVRPSRSFFGSVAMTHRNVLPEAGT
jgi:hypothetical protein